MRARVSYGIAVLIGLYAPTVAYSQVNRFPELVGKWVNLEEQKEIRIESDGSVLSQDPRFPLSGAAGRCINGGGNFCFAGKTSDGRSYACAYHISFPDGNHSVVFGITEDSYIGCPKGQFVRTH